MGQVGALRELEGMVRIFLREWEDSDRLPSEAADELAELVLGFGRLDEARAERLALADHVEQFEPNRQELGAGDC